MQNEPVLLAVEIGQQIVGGELLGPIDPRLAAYRRTTVADGNGNFEFKQLPPGEYYVSCGIYWEYLDAGYAASGYAVRMPTGGIAYGTVRVANGEIAKVIVTR